MPYTGLFVGLTTLDFIYLSDRPLEVEQKLVAQDYLTVAGGPATNAAVAFGSFDCHAKLLTVLGQHPLTELIISDLDECLVETIDLMPEKTDTPPISSIIVMEDTGKRGVISINAVKSQANQPIAKEILNDVDIVLIDGHQIAVSLAIAKLARSRQIPVVIDGGSWKPGLEKILPFADYVIASANFYPPQCQNVSDVFSFLQSFDISYAAITNGAKPIQCQEKGNSYSIAVPSLEAVDTLGAGDIFHGAFCNYILEESFANALSLSAKIAGKSCQHFGTRNWLNY